jgi:hypothetical protein
VAATRQLGGDVPSHESTGSGDRDQHTGEPLSRYW